MIDDDVLFVIKMSPDQVKLLARDQGGLYLRTFTHKSGSDAKAITQSFDLEELVRLADFIKESDQKLRVKS